jgi:S1-C subfamily serine protease
MTKSRMAIAGMAFAWLSVCGTAFAQPAQDMLVGPDPAGTAQGSVKLSNVFIALPAGEQWLSLMRGSVICFSQPVVETWPGGREAQKLSPYFAPFKTELEQAGYKVVTPGEDNLFDPQSGSADYEAAAVITSARIDGCVNPGGALNGGQGGIRGDGSLKVDWQIYSRIRKQVVARVSTSGTSKLSKSVPGGVTRLIVEAFASNVRQLAAQADFRTALSAPGALAKETVQPGQQSKIALLGSRKAPPRKIDEAVGSVVMLDTGTGTGSGLLVSEDGYVLTNAHVVGDSKSVRVRWSDGIEKLGDVVRIAKARDIALVKTEARDRMPLAIKRGAVTPGQRVYAIGTPKDKRFQSTVSSGIVSANRVIDGLRFIQSDTAVSPGSSGGALLDEGGSVIGVTVARYENDGPANLNMFIPIGDAMDFLSLEQN